MESITASPADASSLEHVEGVIAENEELRRRVSDLLHEQLALVETKEQLELKLRLGSGNDAAAVQAEWRALQEKLQLLMTENSLLETGATQSRREEERALSAVHQLELKLAETIGAALRSNEAAEAAEASAASDRERAARAESEIYAARAAADAEHAHLLRLQPELEAARADAAKSDLARVESQREAESARTEMLVSTTTSERLTARAKHHAAELEARAESLEAAAAKHLQEVSRIEGVVLEREAERAHLEAQLKEEEKKGEEAVRALARERTRFSSVAARLAESEEACASLSAKLEQQAVLLSQQADSATRAARLSAERHAAELTKAKVSDEGEHQMAIAREKELLAKAELLRTQLERESRERTDLATQLAHVQQTASTLAGENARLKLVPRSEGVHEQLQAAKLEVEQMRALAESAERRKAAAVAESARERARAETAEGEAARERIRATRGIADAEAKRDAVRTEMEASTKAANRALAEVAEAERRLETRGEFLSRTARAEVAELLSQREFLQAQLGEARTGASELQAMYDEQSRLCEEFQKTARSSAEALEQLRAAALGGGALFGSGASSQLTGIDLPTEADADWTQRMAMAALVVQ